MKKRIALLLCLCMLVPTFASCSESTNADESNTAQGSNPSAVEVVEEETENSRYAANIPAGTNYDGMKFTVATYPNDGTIWGDVDWSATEFTGEVLNDAVYQRMSNVEDLLNIDIEVAYTTGTGDLTTLNTSVTASDNAYQLYTLSAGQVINAASAGSIQDINKFAANGTLDLDAAWWDQNIRTDLSLANHLFCLTGDIGTMYKKSIGVIMFNKNIIAQNQLEIPYDLMDAGQWTVDKMVEMGTKISNDLDGNGVMDQQDQYGLICFCDMMALAMIGCDVPYFTKDADDMPVNTFYTERSVAVVEKLATLMYDPNLTYSWSKNGVGEDPAFKMFQTDKSLFYYGELHAVATMRDMESPFGIMPMPKYDEIQEGYHHCINPNVAATFVIPKTNADYEKCGYIIDALGAESKNELTPAYYDKTLQGKVSRDEESSASLDVIINSIRYDLGYLGGWGIGSMLYSMADGYNADLTSQYKKINKVVSKTLERTIDKLETALAEEE